MEKYKGQIKDMFQKLVKTTVFILLLFIPFLGNSQGIATFSSVNPTNLVVCGAAQTFTIKISNSSLTDSIKGGIASVKLPVGFQYIASSVSTSLGVKESNVSNLNQPVFSIPVITPKDSLKFSISVSVNCSVISYINSGGSLHNFVKLNYNSGTVDSAYTSYFSVGIPSLSISKFTNQSYSGTINDTFRRLITFTNTTNASLSSFSFYIINGSGIYIKSAGGKTYSKSNDTLFFTYNAADFKKIGNKDAYFDKGETIVLTEIDSIISCSSLGNSYVLGWGCSGSLCQKYTSTSNVVLSTYLPDISITTNTAQNMCYVISSANLQSITITNNGSGPAFNMLVDIMQTADVNAGYETFFNSKIDISSIKIQHGSSGSFSSIKPDSTFANYAYSCLGTNPKGRFWIKIPVMKPGDQITVEWNVYNCCISQGYLNSWGYSVSYGDQCNSKNYDLLGMGRSYIYNYQIYGTPVVSSNNLSAGKYSTIYLENNSVYSNLLPGNSSSYLQYQFFIWSGIKMDTSSIYMTDLSGKIIWKPDSIRSVGGIWHVTFALPPPSGFSYYDSRLVMQLLGDTNTVSCNDTANMSYNIYYEPNSSCSCKPLLASGTIPFKINCLNPDNVGLNNAKFTFLRTSYGLPDNNDDGFPDASGSLNFSKIRTDEAMFGDTVTAKFAGRVITDKKYPSWKYAFADLKFTSDYLTQIDISLTIKDSTNKKKYTFSNIPYTKTGADYYYYYGTDTLVWAGDSIPTGFVYKKGDSVLITIRYKVTKNTEDVNYITVDDDFYMGIIPDPTLSTDHYSINKKSTDFYAVGYFYVACCSDGYSAYGCSGVSLSENFYLSIGNCCSNYYGGDIFPYEYRYWASFTKMNVVIPPNFKYESAQVYYYPTQGKGKYGVYSAKPIPTAIHGDTIFFDITYLYDPNTGFFPLSDDGFAGTFIVNCVPTSEAVSTTNSPVKYFEYFNQSAFLGGGLSQAYTDVDYMSYTSPSISLQPALPTVSAQNDTMSWLLYITDNSLYSAAYKPWLAFQNSSGKLTVDTVFDGINLCLDSNGIYHLNWIAPNKSYPVKIKAVMKNCVDDSVKVIFGWDCSSFPDSLAAVPYQTQSLYLYAHPLISSLQTKSVLAPDSLYLCDTASYSVIISNTQAGAASNVNLEINLPSGTKIVKGSARVRYPMQGKMKSISDPDSINPYLYVFKSANLNSELKTNGLAGYYDTAKSEYQILFKLVTDCDYISGSFLSYISTSFDACGNVVNTNGLQEKPLTIIGAKSPYSGLLAITGQTSVSGCGGQSQVRLRFVNNGPVSTDINDYMFIDLPNGVHYVSNSLIPIHNSPSDTSLLITPLGTSTRYSWKIPSGVKMGDSIVYSIKYASDGTLSCEKFPVLIQSATTMSLYCVSKHMYCNVKVLTGIASKNFNLVKPAIHISGVSVTASPAPPKGERISVKATIGITNDTLKANSKSVLKFYDDADKNGKLSAGDILLATDTINFLIKPDSSFSESKSFVAPPGRSCGLLIVWDTSKQNCACGMVQVFVAPVQLPDAGLDTFICSGNKVQIGYDSISGYTYNWSPSTGLSNPNTSNPIVTLSNATSSIIKNSYTLTTNRIGCTTKDSVHVSVSPNLKITAGSPKSICLGGNISLGSSPTASGGSGKYSYLWTPNTGLSSTTVANPTATPTKTTVYTLFVSDSKGCSANDSVLETVNPIPKANAGPDRIMCIYDSVQLGGSPSASGTTSPYSYAWKPTSGVSRSNIANPKASPSSTTTYIMFATDGKGCHNSDTVIVTVNPLPKLNAGINKGYCFGDSAILGGTPTASGSNGWYKYRWTPNIAISDTISARPRAAPSATKTYYLHVVDSEGCQNNDSVTVTVNPKLYAYPGSNRFICNGDTTTIGGAPPAKGGSNSFNYSWSPSTSLSSTTSANPVASPKSSIKYTLTVTDSKGCIDTNSIFIYVNPKINVDAGGNKFICYNKSVTIGGATPGSGGTGTLSYNWSPATALSSSSATNPLASPTSTTSYTLTVTDADGCTDTNSAKVTVNAKIIANAGNNQYICYGSSVKIGGTTSGSGGTGALQYSWTPSTGLNSTTSANPTAGPLSTTKYTLTVTDSKGCTDTSSVFVTVNPKLTSSAGTNKFICYGSSIKIGGTVPGSGGTGTISYSWSPSTGLNSSTSANPIANPTGSTKYRLAITDSKGCTDTNSVFVTVNPKLVSNAGTNKFICYQGSVNLGGSPSGTGGTGSISYSWSPSTSLNSTTVSNPVSSALSSVKYTLTIKDSLGCIDTNSVYLTVNPKLTANAGANKFICYGSSVIIGGAPSGTGGTGTINYSWSPSTSLSTISGSNPLANPASSTRYALTISDGKGCTDTSSILVTVNPKLTSNAGSNKFICFGSSTTIGGATAGSGGSGTLSYSWTPATALSSASSSNPTASPTSTTRYVLSVTDGKGCTDTNSVLITVNPKLIVNAGANTLICYGKSTILGGSPTATGGKSPYTYSWTPATGLSGISIANPKASPTSTTIYTLVVTDGSGCSVSGSLKVFVNPVPVIYAGSDDSICRGDSIIINGTSIYNYKYAWSPGKYLKDSTILKPKASPPITTSFIVTATDTVGCTNTDTMVVNVRPKTPILPPVLQCENIINIHSITLNWNALSANNQFFYYTVYRKSGNGSFLAVAKFYPIATQIWTDTLASRTDSIPYSYFITVTNHCNIEGIASDTLNSILLSTKKIGDKTLAFTWNKINSKNSYYTILYNSGPGFKVLDSVKGTSYILHSCNLNANYKIALNSGSCSSNSFPSPKIMLIDSTAPSVNSIIDVTTNSWGNIQVNFKPSDSADAKSYGIYRGDSSGVFKLIGTVAHIKGKILYSYQDNSVSASHTLYFYKIKSTDTCGNISSFSTVHSPSVLKGKPADYADHLNWSPYKGFAVKNYTVQLLKSGVWTNLSGSISSTDTAYLDTLIPCNVTRYYRIQVTENGGNNSISYSDTIHLTPFDTIKPLAPSITYTTVPTNGQVQINWVKSPSNDVENYTIYRESGGVFKAIDSVGNVNVYVDKSANTSLSNCYEVVAVDSCARNRSRFSPTHCTMALSVTNNGCEPSNYLSWNAYSGWTAVAKYEIYRSVNGGLQSLLDSTTSITAFKDTGLNFHNNYCYQIKAYQKGGPNVSYSNTFCKQVYFVDTPHIVVVTKLNTSTTAGQVKVQWVSQKGIPHLAFYRLYYSYNHSPYKLLKDSIPIAQDTFIHTGLNTKTGDHYYYIQTVDSCHIHSEPSTFHKTIDLTFHIGQLVHQLNWSPYMGWPVKYYIVQHAINNNPLVDEDTLPGKDTSLHKFPAPCNTRVVYRVRAVSYAGIVSYSDSMGGQAIDTIPSNPPTMANVSYLTGKLIKIDYLGSDSLDTYGYVIKRSENGGPFVTAGFENFTKPHAPMIFVDTVLKQTPLCYQIITEDSCLNLTFSQEYCTIYLSGQPENLSDSLKWKRFSGYGIKQYEVMIYNNGSWQNLANTNTDTAYFHSPLSCNVPRSYKIEGFGNTGFNTFSDSISLTPFDTTRPYAPVLNYASVSGPGSVNLNWQFSASAKVKDYEVDYKASSATVWKVFKTVRLQNTITVTGLHTHDTAYDFRIIAIDTCAGNRSFPSNIHQTILLGGQDQNLANKLTWSAYAGFGIQRYVIFKWINNAWARLDSVGGTILTYTDNGLHCNVPYSYKLLAYSSTGGFQTYSDSISLTPFDTTRPIAPVINYATVTGPTTISLNWQYSASKKVKDYEIDYKSSSGAAWRVFKTVRLQTSITITGLHTHDTAYDFRVIAIDTCAGNKSFPANIHQTILLGGIGQNLANKLTWSAYTGFGINRYVIFKWINNAWTRLDSVAGSVLTYTDNGLHCNVPYSYKLLAYSSSGGFQTYSDSMSLTPFDTTRPIAPVINYATVTSPSTINLNWQYSVSKKVKDYEIDYKTSSSAVWRVFKTVRLQTSITITGLHTHDTAYDFRVIAIDTCMGNRSLSGTIHQSILLSGTGGNLVSLLNWSAYQGFAVNRYVIFKWVKNKWTRLDSVNGTKTAYNDSAILCHASYNYKILAYISSGGFASYSDSIMVQPIDTVTPPTPTIQYASVIKNGLITVYWNKSVPIVKQYNLWYKSAHGPWISIALVTNSYSYTVNALNTKDSIYSFRLDVIDSCSSKNSRFGPVHTVMNMGGTKGNLSNTVTWTPYTGFTVKKYYIYTWNKKWQLLDSVSSAITKYVNQPLPCNMPVNYRIGALDITGKYLSFSDSIQLVPFDTIKPDPPILFAATVLPNSTVQINWHWDLKTRDKSFEIWRSVNKAPATKIGTVTYDSTFIDKNVNPKLNRNAYFIIAVDSCSFLNRSKPSATDTLMQIKFKTGGCKAYMQINWTKYDSLAGGTDSFRIYKAENKGLFAYLKTVPGNQFQYADSLVDTLNHFSYKVEAFNHHQKYSSFSDSVGSTPWIDPRAKSPDLVYNSVVKTSPIKGIIHLQWNSYPFAIDTFAKGYNLYGSNTSSGSQRLLYHTADKTAINYTVGGLNTTDSLNYFILKVYNTCKLDGAPSVVNSPIKLKLQNKNLEVDLSWKPYQTKDSVKTYKIYRSDNGFNFVPYAILPGNQVSYKDTNVYCKHIYFYQVSALTYTKNLPESFSDSAGVTVFDTIKPAAPKIYFVSTNATGTNTGSVLVVFKGNVKRSRAGYNIYYATDGVHYALGDSFINLKTDTLIWQQNQLNTAGKPYSFYINAFDSCGNLSLNSDTQAVVFLNVVAKDHRDSLYWTGYKGWKNWHYLVERKKPGYAWIPLDNVISSDNNYVDHHTKCDTFYIYRIISADNAKGALTSLSEEAGITASDTAAPKPPVINYASVIITSRKHGRIEVSWNRSKSTDVKYYNVYHQTDPTSAWIMIGSKLSDTTFIDSTLDTYRNTYSYKVEAADSCSAPNTSRSVVHTSIALTATPGDQKIILNWTAYKGWKPLAYEIIRGAVPIGKVAGSVTTFIDSNVICPNNYMYIVIAINPDDTSLYAVSSIDSAKPYDNIPPAAPYLIRATVSQPNNTVSLEWTRSKEIDVKGYRIMRQNPEMNYFAVIDSVMNPSDTSFTDVVNNISDSLCYKVEAFDHCGNYSFKSNPACVIIVQGQAKSLANTLHWNPYKQWPGGVAYYNLYRKVNDSIGYQLLDQFTSPQFIYTDTGFEADGKDYCYRIEAIENGGLKANSWSTELCLVQQPLVWIPDAFTPNITIGVNDFFGPKGLFIAKYEMDIYNRWGQRLYTTSNSLPWDGTYGGTPVGEGVYLYHITVYSHSGSRYYFTGTVEVVH